MAIAITALSGGNTPADGSDPRTFPAIWNTTATALEGVADDLDTLETLVGANDLDSLVGVAITTPVAGDVLTYNGTSWLNGSPVGSILQVVSTTKTDTYSESLATGVLSSNLVTGLTASITPRSTSSKILVTVSVPIANSSYYGYGSYVMRRDGTAIAVPDAAGSRTQLTAQGGSLSQNSVDKVTLSQSFLDSPGTTSSITYGISLHNPASGTATVYANRSFSDQDNSRFSRPISTITLMEVAG